MPTSSPQRLPGQDLASRSLRAGLAGASFVVLALASPAALAQNESEVAALPDVSLQSQITTGRALDRLRFLAGLEHEGGTSVFGTFLDNDLDFDAQGAFSGFKAETRGGLVGFETSLYEGFTIGAALSRQSGDITHPSQGGSGYRETTLHLFSGYDLGGLQLGLSGDYGRTKYDNIFRPVAAAPGSVTGSTEGNNWRIGATAGFDFMMANGVRISPNVAYDYFHTVVDAYNETGNAALQRSFQRQSINAQRVTAGVNFEFPAWQVADGMELVPLGDITYSRTISGDRHTLQATGGAGALNLAAPYYLDSGIDAGLGAELRFDSGWALGANYSHVFTGDTKGTRSIGVSLRRRF